MNITGGMKASHKFYISIIGLITGFLLFIASFSILLDNTLFNSEYYKTASEKLGTYSLIAEIAENPVKDLTAKISESSDTSALSIQTADSVMGQQKSLMKSLVEDNISDKMVRLNVDSLIDGLLRYFKGETVSLPDLQLAGPAALKSINLQVLIMYMGESRISNALHLVSLSQYILVHIPVFLMFLLPVIVVYMLKKTPGVIQYWLKRTAFFYSMFYLAAALLTQLLPHIFLKSILSKIDFLQFSSLSGLLSNHIFYFANLLTFYSLQSGMLLYAGVNTAILANTHFLNEKKSGTMPYTELVSKGGAVWVMAIALISGTIFYISLQSSSFEFYNRNLGQTLAQLWESNPLYRVTDARDDLVYLLEVHMVDSDTKNPLANIGIHIEQSSSQGSCYQTASILTDSTGTATLMLNKGTYTLTLDSYNMFTGFGDTQSHSYQFEMLTPGKSELNISLCENNSGLPYLADASLQFIP